MKIVMGGATGFVGTHLRKAFEGRGWEVVPIGRRDYVDLPALAQKLSGADVVINLAGASVGKRWTEEYKRELVSSRVDTTKAIVSAMAAAHPKPRLFISTSAVGIYAPGETFDEDNARYADDFLGKLAQQWEAEAQKAEALGVRTVIFRFGVVLGSDGGALARMRLPFSLGLGGTIGDGKQPFSWVHVEDLVNAYFFVIDRSEASGIYNLTAPEPTTNGGLTAALGAALHRPAMLRIPTFVLRLQLGEGADVLLNGPRVIPKRLMREGFHFRFATITDALTDLVAKR